MFDHSPCQNVKNKKRKQKSHSTTVEIRCTPHFVWGVGCWGVREHTEKITLANTFFLTYSSIQYTANRLVCQMKKKSCNTN